MVKMDIITCITACLIRSAAILVMTCNDIITCITACLIRSAAILVMTSVSTVITVIILYYQ